MQKSTHTQSEDLASLALSYYNTARAADGANLSLSDIGSVFDCFPVLTLISMSIELSLKSYLLRHRRTKSQIKSLGHDLVEAYAMCRDESDSSLSKFPNLDIRVLEILTDLHKNMVLRYNEKSALGRLPNYKEVLLIARECLIASNIPCDQVKK